MSIELFKSAKIFNLKHYLGVPAALAALVAVGGCAQTYNSTVEQPGGDTYEESVVERPETLEMAMDNPDEYLDETITIVGEVAKVYNAQAFVVRGEDYFEPDDGMLVIAYDPEGPMPEEGEYVEITGEMRSMVLADLDKDYDITLENAIVQELAATFAEAPFLVAENIDYTQVSDEN